MCWSLFWYSLLCVLSSFAMILTRKGELVALHLLFFGCLFAARCPTISDSICADRTLSVFPDSICANIGFYLW